MRGNMQTLQLTGGFQPRIFLLWGNIASLHAALCPNHSVIFASKKMRHPIYECWDLRMWNPELRCNDTVACSSFMYSLCVKGVMQQERVLSVATLSVSSLSLCLFMKVCMQALLIVAYQVSSDLHSVDASLFTTFDVHKNTLDLPVLVRSGVGRNRPDIICAPR